MSTPRRLGRVGAMLALLVSVIVGLPLAGGSNPAGATPGDSYTVSTLGITTFNDIAVDPATGRVYITGSDKVVVVNTNNTIAKTIALSGASGLAVEGSQVWVTQVGAGKVSRISTSALTVTQTYTIGSRVSDSIAVVNGIPWFPGGGSGNYYNLLRLDPATGTVENHGGDEYGARVTEIPGSTTHVLFYNTGLSPYSIYRTALAGSTVTKEDDVEHGVGSNLREVVATDSGTFVAASGAPYEFTEFNLATMDETGVVYDGEAYPNGVAFSPQGDGVIAGATQSANEVFVYEAGNPTAAYFGTSATEIPDGGIELAPDASKMHIVASGGSAGSSYILIDVSLKPELSTMTPASIVKGTSPTITVSGLGFEFTKGVKVDGSSVSFNVGSNLTFHPPASLSVCVAHTVVIETSFGNVSKNLQVGPFSDVAGSHSFCADINWLSTSGVSTGFPDGTYRPTNAVTRQSVAAMLYRFAGSPDYTPPGVASFSDVPTSHPFYKEIEWLAENHIANGYPDGKFQPTGGVTRQSIAAMLYRYAESPDYTPPGVASFSDVPTSHPFFKEVEWMASNSFASGYSNGTFLPSGGVTRQSIAAFVHRYAMAA